MGRHHAHGFLPRGTEGALSYLCSSDRRTGAKAPVPPPFSHHAPRSRRHVPPSPSTPVWVKVFTQQSPTPVTCTRAEISKQIQSLSSKDVVLEPRVSSLDAPSGRRLGGSERSQKIRVDLVVFALRVGAAVHSTASQSKIRTTHCVLRGCTCSSEMPSNCWLCGHG